MSMRKVLVAAFSLLVLCSLGGATVVSYDWEDGGTVLGMFGVGTPPIIASNVGAPDPVYSGTRSLRLQDNASSGTPQVFVAWIKGLQNGDEVTASIWRYDVTPGTSPSCRMWGHWNDDPNDIDGYNGSASGDTDYGLGEGWDMTDYTWTVSDGHTGLIVEVRTYSSLGDTVWVDALTVTAPDHATITVPEPVTLGLLALGLIPVVMRRRQSG